MEITDLEPGNQLLNWFRCLSVTAGWVGSELEQKGLDARPLRSLAFAFLRLGGLSADGSSASRDWKLLLWCNGAARGGIPDEVVLARFQQPEPQALIKASPLLPTGNTGAVVLVSSRGQQRGLLTEGGGSQ